MSKSSDVIGVGIVGMGFMGWRHVEAYSAAARAGLPCRVAAVCDPDAARRRAPGGGGNIASTAADAPAMDGAASYASLDHMLSDPSIGLVSVCTPTTEHVGIAMKVLESGRHALVEKPVALSADAVRPLADAARRAKTLCMPAHCMRFWPGWDWLRERIVSKEFGRTLSATFLRAGARPAWSSFYADPQRSGGALGDFHIHDADFILWAFGKPEAVCCSGSNDHVTTLYRWAGDGPGHASAEAGWTRSTGAGFRMRFTVAFERATAEFEMGREPALMRYDHRGAHAVPLPGGSGYEHEVRHLLEAIQQGRRDLRVTMEDALATAELIDAERRSLASGAWVKP